MMSDRGKGDQCQVSLWQSCNQIVFIKAVNTNKTNAIKLQFLRQ